MKRKITTLACMMFLLLGIPLQTHAFTFKELPTAKKSEQWYVKIDKAKNTASGSLQPKKGIFDTYSLFIENIGKNVKNTTIEVYRNEPNTQTLYFLFNSTDSPISNHSTTFTHENFPIDVRAGKIEVVVKWEEKQYNHNKHPECAGRVYKQTFVFTEE
ncbi:TPA: hypothetical protein ACGXQL_004212 [Bacillus cereus]|uniref:hypothetical protein n=1 Tax=Bacillus TaxID=1386 RepID=UPI0001A15B8E|nr:MULTISPECIES: hypothetical protein [Bacillus]EEL90557.1 hypothetical protein bcere0030_55150 [Bacillus cereus AH1273]MED2680662.1 hypothetical protein [Bacillus thuringiensis]EKS7862065.1 hypothetical protein [Bacillus cereus]MBL3742298.1 hypothetical protein [Bacillus cereus]MBL3864958.1 hypothetical protein [Bacillus cereus]